MAGYAGGITVDGGAAGQHAALDTAQNGVPVVNITNPSASGVSRNTFLDFNVNSRGVILNNSLTIGVSQLGGVLLGNSNFTGGQTARIILNEVTGTNRSNINGTTEIFGGRAEYVLVNPNGITCNGCGFINTPRITLSTGIADVSNASLRGFNVTSGDVRFEGPDVNLTTLDSFDIISHTASFAASVYAGSELNVITGKNYVDYNTKSATVRPDSSATPRIGIDSSTLGGMYAGKINLVATENGVGVNTQGNLGASTSDITINANGRIEFKNINAKGDIKVNSTHSGVKNSGHSYSDGNTQITAHDDIELTDGFTSAKAHITLNSLTLNIGSAASVMAGVDAVTSDGDITFTNNDTGILNINTLDTKNNAGLLTASNINVSSGSFSNTGFIQSSGNITITANNISNLNNYAIDTSGNITGGINSGSKLTLTSLSGAVNNTGGALSSADLLTITSAGKLINSSLIHSGSDIVINAISIDNSNSYYTDSNGKLSKGIIAVGTIGITTTYDGIDNNSGTISGNALTVNSAGKLINNSGLINSIHGIDIITAGMSNNSANIFATNDIIINAGNDNISNMGGIINTSGSIDINHTTAFSNTGLISGTKNISIRANSIDNSNSYNTNPNGALNTGILSNGDINLSAIIGTISNTMGAIYGKNLTLSSAGQVDNSFGLVQATNTASITAIGLNNSNTYSIGSLVKGILAELEITLDAGSGDINNTNGAIKSGGEITTTNTAELTNTGLIHSTGDTNITAASITNSNNLYTDSNGKSDRGILSSGKLNINTTANITNKNGALYSSDQLTVTSDGAFTNTGLIASDNDIIVIASIVNNSGGIITDLDVGITANTGDVHNANGQISGNNIGIAANQGNFDNTNGFSKSSDTTTISAKGVINDDTYKFDDSGTLSKGIISGHDFTATTGTNGFSNNNGAVNGSSKVTINSTGNFTNSGLINSAGLLKITAANISNSNSYLLNLDSLRKGLISQNTIDLTATIGDIINTDGAISSNGLTLNASGQLINNKLIQSTSNIEITSGSVANTGLIQSGGNLNITAGKIDNSNSYIVTNDTLIGGLIATGTVNLNSGIYDIINKNGGISANKTLSLNGYNIDNNYGYISANSITGTSLVIATNIVNNKSGYILSNANLSVFGTNGNNATNASSTSGGVISAQNNLDVKMTDGEMLNSTGNLYAGNTFTGQNINNNGGRIQAANQIDITASDSYFDNRNGVVLAFANGSIVNIDNSLNIISNHASRLVSILDTDFDDPTSPRTIDGTITSGGHVNITAESVTNNANITVGDYITLIATHGSITNSSGAKLISGTSVTLHAQNSINNYGEISGPIINLTTTSGSLNNYNGQITSSGTLTATIAGQLYNTGRISSEAETNITAGSVYNSNSQIASNDNLIITTTEGITNTNNALLYSTDNMALNASSIDNKTNAQIFSMLGNISMTGTTNITNNASNIEAMTGNIVINTGTFTNTMDRFASVYMPNFITDPQGNKSVDYSSIDYNQATITNGWGGHGWGQARYVFRIKESNGTAASLLGDNDITINATTIINKASLISSGHDITLSGSVTNQANNVQDWLVFSWNTEDYGGGIENSIDNPTSKNDVTKDPAISPLQNSTAPSSIIAVNNLSGAITDLNNAVHSSGGNAPDIRSNSTHDTSTASIPGHAVETVVNNTQLNQNHIYTNTDIISTKDTTDTVSSAQISSGASIIITNSSSPSTVALSFITLPTGTNALFKTTTAPDSNYVIETNLAFIDQTKFLGSDYFCARIHCPSGQRNIGDAFYTTNLVRKQIFDKTARQYIENGISTDFGQMQALMDNAVTEKTALNLSVGIELTQTQIASLSSDIIWLVDEIINGEHVLIPVVYLTQATLNGLSGNGAVIAAGENLTLTAANSINNSGTITSGRNLSLAAGNNITNSGGLIKAENNVTLVANDGDVINQAIIHSSSTGGNIASFLQAQGNITAGGNLSVTASNDVDALGSIVTAAGGIDINAGNDVNVISVSLRNRSAIETRKYTKTDDVTTHISSEITAGTNLNITSSNNTIVQASNLTAGNDVNINAGGTVAMLTTTDSAFHEEKKSSENLLWQSSSDVGSYKETVSHVEITAGGNVNITGANGVVVQYKDTGNLNDSIAQLATAPELAWMENLQTLNNVQFQGVQEAYKSWDYQQSGLTSAGAAIIAIAVAAATAGAGTALGGMAVGATGVGTGITATTASGSIVLTGAYGAAANAAFTALASQAAIGLVNNKGNIGKTLNELASSDTVKNMAFAALTAGVTSGMGNEIINSALGTTPITPKEFIAASQATQAVTNATISATAQSAIYGQDFGKSFTTNLIANATYAIASDAAQYVGNQYHNAELNASINGTTVSFGEDILHIGAHAAIGCAAGAATSGGCGNGAIGGAVGELSAQLSENYLGTDKLTSANMGQYTALGTALLTGADEKGIYTVNGTALNAIHNNYLSPKNRAEWDKQVDDKCGKGSSPCRDAMDQQYKDSTFASAEILAAGVSPNYTSCDALCQQMVVDTQELPFVIIGGVLKQEISNLIDVMNAPGSFIKNGAYTIDENGNVILYDTKTGKTLIDSALDVSLLAAEVTSRGLVGSGSLIDYVTTTATFPSKDVALIDSSIKYIPDESIEYFLAGEWLPNETLVGSTIYDYRSPEFLDILRSESDLPLLSSVAHVNLGRFHPVDEVADRHLINCVYCGAAVDNTLRGYPTSAMPLMVGVDGFKEGRRGVGQEIIENFFEGKFEPMGRINNISERMLMEGPGSTGIVALSYLTRAEDVIRITETSFFLSFILHKKKISHQKDSTLKKLIIYISRHFPY